MQRNQLHTAIVGFAAAVSLVGCAASPIVQGIQETLDQQAEIQNLAFPPNGNWMNGAIASGEAMRLRKQRMAGIQFNKVASYPGFNVTPSQPAERKLQYAPLGSEGHNTRITGAPTYDFANGREWWLTEDGKIAERGANFLPPYTINDPATGLPLAGESFPNTYLTNSYPSTYGFACSKSNKIYCINLNTKATVAVYDMKMTDDLTSGADPAVDFCPPPWVAGNNVYAINNKGVFYHVRFDWSTGAFTLIRRVAMPRTTDPDYTEYYRASPVVYGGKAYIGSWRKHDTTESADQGSVRTVTVSTGAIGATEWPVGPVYGNRMVLALTPTNAAGIAFTPVRNSVAIINLFGTEWDRSLQLVLNPADAATSVHPSLNPSLYPLQRITADLAVDDFAGALYAVNCNALWKLSFRSPTFDTDPTATNISNVSFGERAQSFKEYTKTWCAPTFLGSTSGTASGTKLITNVCAPYSPDGVTVNVLDNFGNKDEATVTTLNQFLAGANENIPPTRTKFFNVTTEPSNPDPAGTQVPGTYISQNWFKTPMELFFNTTSNYSALTTSPTSVMHVYTP